MRDYLLESVVADYWDVSLLEVLARVMMERIDELMLISPKQLHLATGIPARRIVTIYEEAVVMIRNFHLTVEDDIEDIRGMRQRRGKGVEDGSPKII